MPQQDTLATRVGGGRGNPPAPTAAPATSTIDWQHDPDFDALPIQEKHKALMSIDPEYASLPAPEQAKALQSIHTRHQMPEQPTPQRGFFGTLSDKISAAGKSLISKDSLESAAGNFILPGYSQIKGAYDTGKEMYRQATRPLPDYIQKEQAFPGSYRAATTLSPLVPGLDPEAQERASQSGDTGALAAEIAVPAAIAAGGEAIGHGIPAARRSLAQRMYDPETGQLTPGYHSLVHPTELPEQALRKIAPEPTEQVAARNKVDVAKARDAYYENEAQARVQRGKQQAALDASHEKALNQRIAERQQELADQERLKEQDAQARMRRGREQEGIDKTEAQAESLRNMPMRPLIGSPEEWNAYDQQMGILEREGTTAGKYHAARGSVNKKLNLQQRMEGRFRK